MAPAAAPIMSVTISTNDEYRFGSSDCNISMTPDSGKTMTAARTIITGAEYFSRIATPNANPRGRNNNTFLTASHGCHGFNPVDNCSCPSTYPRTRVPSYANATCVHGPTGGLTENPPRGLPLVSAK